MDKLEMRKATYKDIELLLTVGRQTFFEKFIGKNSEENILQ